MGELIIFKHAVSLFAFFASSSKQMKIMGAHLYISNSGGSKQAQASQDHLTLFHLAFVFLQSCLCDVVFRYNSSPTRAAACVYVRVVISPLQNNKVCLSTSWSLVMHRVYCAPRTAAYQVREM